MLTFKKKQLLFVYNKVAVALIKNSQVITKKKKIYIYIYIIIWQSELGFSGQLAPVWFSEWS